MCCPIQIEMLKRGVTKLIFKKNVKNKLFLSAFYTNYLPLILAGKSNVQEIKIN